MLRPALLVVALLMVGDPASAESEPQEVVVQGTRREAGATTLPAADIREMPGAFGDPFRAVEALPGVSPALSGVPYFFVRGAPPNDNGYFLDGVRIPWLFHVGLGPGVIHPGLLDRVDFYPGAAPARFGGSAGAILAGETRRPTLVSRGQASLRLVDAGALVESPFADDHATALVAGRYGYPGPILSAVSDVRLGYWDYQTRLTYWTSPEGTLGLLAFGSHDYLGHVESDGTRVEDLRSDFHRLDLRYDHETGRSRVRAGATLGYDLQGTDPTYLTNRSAALRLQAEHQVAPELRLRGGLEGRLDVHGFRRESPPDPDEAIVPSSADPPPTNVTPAAYADVVWRLAPGVELVPGARVTLFASSRADPGGSRAHATVTAFAPRLSARARLAPGVAWLSALGSSHQYPVLRVGALPAAAASGAGFPEGNARLQEVWQQSHGVEIALPAELVLTATGFFSRFLGLTDLTASCVQIEPPSAPAGEGPRPGDPYFCPSNAPVKGHAYGLEVMVRRSLSERLAGWLVYTLSRAEREARFLTLQGREVVARVPAEFDRTHVLNAILAYDLGRRWRAGTRLAFYTGVPYSRLVGNLPAPPYHDRRDPPFYRVDVRFEKQWLFGNGRALALVMEGQNVTLTQEANTLGMDCAGDITSDAYTTTCERGKVGPIAFPSIGVEATF